MQMSSDFCSLLTLEPSILQSFKTLWPVATLTPEVEPTTSPWPVATLTREVEPTTKRIEKATFIRLFMTKRRRDCRNADWVDADSRLNQTRSWSILTGKRTPKHQIAFDKTLHCHYTLNVPSSSASRTNWCIISRLACLRGGYGYCSNEQKNFSGKHLDMAHLRNVPCEPHCFWQISTVTLSGH